MKKCLFFLFVFFFIIRLGADVPKCYRCGKTGKMAYRNNANYYCSKKCVPPSGKCYLCNDVLFGAGQTVLVDRMGKTSVYCLKCIQNPKCATCHRPLRSKSRKNNAICHECSAGKLTLSKAYSIMRKLRLELAKDYGYNASHRITLRIVDHDKIVEVARSSTAIAYMQYRYQTRTVRRSRKNQKEKRTVEVKENCQIFLSNTITEENIHRILVHELTHDYLFHHLGEPQDNIISEGICEAMAGAWLEKNGRIKEFELLKQNPDQVYGSGFNKIYPQLRRYGFKKMLEMNKSSFEQYNFR